MDKTELLKMIEADSNLQEFIEKYINSSDAAKEAINKMLDYVEEMETGKE